jgi:hypothetical protein
MSDHEEIRNLSYRYTFALDAGDFDEVGRLLGTGTLRPSMPGLSARPSPALTTSPASTPTRW